MNHLATIQTEFTKEARKWNDLTLDEQREYLKKHPASKRRLKSKRVLSPLEKKLKGYKHAEKMWKKSLNIWRKTKSNKDYDVMEYWNSCRPSL